MQSSDICSILSLCQHSHAGYPPVRSAATPSALQEASFFVKFKTIAIEPTE